MDTHKHLELERINEKFTYLDNLLRSNDINILKYFSFPKSPESNVVEYFSFPKSPKSNAFNKYHIKNRKNLHTSGFIFLSENITFSNIKGRNTLIIIIIIFGK